MKLIKGVIVASFFVRTHGETSPKCDRPPLQFSEKNSTSVAAGKEQKATPQTQKTPAIDRSKKRPRSKEKQTKTSVSSPASASLRRIKKEYKDAVQMGICYDWVKGRLVTSASTNRDTGCSEAHLICLGPLATNLRHWHFSFRGVKNSLYEGGIYHGRILLPKNYPSSPPRVQLMTPSGRFKPFTDICLSASSYHPESWTPRWTVLSLVQALRLHMLTNPQEIGGVLSKSEETLEYARRSLSWKFAWLVGNTKTRIVVDHQRLLKQGVLAIDLSESESDALERQNEIELSDSSQIAKDEKDASPMEETDMQGTDVIIGHCRDEGTEVTQPSEFPKAAVEAVQTLEEARDQKRKIKKKPEKTKPSNAPQRGDKRGHGGVLATAVGSILSTPTGRGLIFLFILWLCSRK